MNFNDIYKKIAEIDAQPSKTTLNECGDMMGALPSPVPKQSDSVTMNVSMNGSGAGGIRDLMAILKNIEDAEQPMPHGGDVDKLFGADEGPEMTVDLADEFANEPNEQTAGIDAVTPTGDDMHSKGSEAEKVNGGGNPMGMDESLVARLAAHYQEIKEGEKKEKEPEGLYSKKRFETDSQRLARIAREKRQAEKKERMRNDFNAEMERE